jgi:2-haloacid dehalogenase
LVRALPCHGRGRGFESRRSRHLFNDLTKIPVPGLLPIRDPDRAVNNPLSSVKALFFDVFGTLVDWRTSVAREAEAILGTLGYDLDWIAFADAWRGEYQPGMEEVRAGRISFLKLDILHRRNLVRLLPRFGLQNLSDEVLDDLTLVWHRLDAWPDVPVAMARLKKKFWVAPCSNGNISLMVDLARRNNMPWDAILGSEIAGDFKPKPRVYLAACEAFSLAPSQCMMVAAHTRDLIAASKCGLRTGHIARVNEYGPNTGEARPTAPVDVAGKDLADLADKLDT